MFEAQNQPPARNASASVAGGQNPAQPQRSASPSPVEDIFADTDAGTAPSIEIAGQSNALNTGKLKPIQAQAQPEVPLSQMSGQSKSVFPFKTLIAIIGIIIVIASIALASYFIWKSRTKINTAPAATAPNTESSANSSAPESVGQDNADSNASESENQANDLGTGGIIENFQEDRINRALNPIPDDLASKDTDQDGLTDAKEYDLGTNPRLVDSDSDGLSDWEETAIFGTEPLNKDSDNDAYSDGEEVQNGYNPLGAGKLLNFEQSQ